MKYALVTAHRYDDLLVDLKAGKCRSGLYQWAGIFHPENPEAHILYLPELEYEDPEKYDVLHVNFIGGDLCILPKLRELLGRNSSTRIVANVDTCAELWLQCNGHPFQAISELKCADVVFHVEPRGAEAVSLLLDRPVPVVPHPVNYDYIARFRKPFEERERVYGILHTVWDQQMTIPWLVLKDLGVHLGIFNFERGAGDTNIAHSLFAAVYRNLPHETFLEVMAGIQWVYEPRILQAWGRSAVEAAVLGLAGSGSNRVEVMRRCYPETTHSPHAFADGHAMARRLTTDDEFTRIVGERAAEAARYYDLPRAKERFMALLDTHEDGGKVSASSIEEISAIGD